jgi:alkyldihydroxyacetonephosphate synthase
VKLIFEILYFVVCRQELLKWNGWGYRDSGFVVREGSGGIVEFQGQRYPLGSGSVLLPHFTQWVMTRLGANFDRKVDSVLREEPSTEAFPSPVLPPGFIAALEGMEGGVSYSVEGPDRLFRSHGHTLHDIFALRSGCWGRIPDIVIWPESHRSVECLVELAEASGVVLIPFGGGTSVSEALSPPDLNQEPRPIASLDTSQMNRILGVDEVNLSVTAQAGIIGKS